MTGPRQSKYTCGNCYTEFDSPDDGRCPTCKVREIVPMGMSEKRDPNDESDSVSLTYGDFCRAIDENVELKKRVMELERFMRLIVNTTAHPIAETYSLSGHMNAVEYAKHMLKETHNEASE